ncbi:hypothetical protein [Mesorhizobium sp. KR2-14]|uniref:hypothetical protein n=1 Tax=Mesorhizobium sp. KR2-14 TaxID=3156610 RepID=UPI0032B45A8B
MPAGSRPGLIYRFFDWLLLKVAVRRSFDGLELVNNFASGKGGELESVERALALIREFDPVRYRRLRRDLARIRVILLTGVFVEFSVRDWTCRLDGRFMNQESTTIERVALAIAHVATHARLFKMGFGYEEKMRGRIERICVRREIALAAKLPTGEGAGNWARAALNARPALSDDALLERRDVGARDNFLYLGVSPVIADAVVSYVGWRRRRRARKLKINSSRP